MFWKMNLINFSAYWKKNRASIIAGVILVLTYSGFLLACSIAYERFGILNLTQNIYLGLGSVSTLMCTGILVSKGKRSTYILLPLFVALFLLFDIAIRLLVSIAELQPGIHRDLVSWRGAAAVLLVRTLFIAAVLSVLYFRTRFKPALYFVSACLFAVVAFYLSAVHVPLVLGENLYSHKVLHVATNCLRTFACNDDSSFLLAPSTKNEYSTPFQARIIRNGNPTLIFDDWEDESAVRGFYCNVSENDFRFVLDTTLVDDDMARLRLLQYLDGQVAYEAVYECLPCMVPVISRNCLSPEGSLVALNNCSLVNFFYTSTNISPFEASSDPEYVFVEWTAAEEAQPLFYDRTGNRALLIDTGTGEPTASRTLSFRAPIISSLTLSPDGQRLLYAGEFTDGFFFDSFGQGSDSVLLGERTGGYLGNLFWLNNKHFVYISNTLTLNEVDTQTSSMRKISQAFEIVLWVDYEPRGHRLVWTTLRMGKESTIHTYTLKEEEEATT